MTESRVAPLTFVQDNLWAILAAAGAAWGGYLTGMTTVNHRLDSLEQRTAKMESRLDDLSPRLERLDANVTILAEQAKEDRRRDR